MIKPIRNKKAVVIPFEWIFKIASQDKIAKLNQSKSDLILSKPNHEK